MDLIVLRIWVAYLEGFTELSWHAAIDGKVDWVREANEEVGEEDEDIDDRVVEHSELEGGVEDVQHR